jgi:hypothetical protein
MFHLIRLIVWIAGVLVVAYFVLGYFGYEVNQHYFDQSKAKCQELIAACQKNIIHQGVDNVKNCEYQCIDPTLIIRKKSVK